MILFRRKIRQTLLKNGRTIKYSLYVIGEIILVVIGILIALSVNNSNQKKIDDLRVERFSDKLKVQLEENLAAVNDHIEVTELFYGNSKRLLAIVGDTIDVDTEAKIDSLILFNSFDHQLNLDMNIILESRENGDIALISDESLSQSIYSFITYYNKILEDERITNSNLNNQFSPYLSKHYNLRNLMHRISEDEGLGRSKIYSGENYKMLADQEFENQITLRIIHNNEILDSYIELKERILHTYNLL